MTKREIITAVLAAVAFVALCGELPNFASQVRDIDIRLVAQGAP